MYWPGFTPGLFSNFYTGLVKWDLDIESELYGFARNEGRCCNSNGNRYLKFFGSSSFQVIRDRFDIEIHFPLEDEVRAAQTASYTSVVQVDAFGHRTWGLT